MKIAQHGQICTCARTHSYMKCDKAGLEQSGSQIVIRVPGRWLQSKKRLTLEGRAGERITVESWVSTWWDFLFSWEQINDNNSNSQRIKVSTALSQERRYSIYSQLRELQFSFK